MLLVFAKVQLERVNICFWCLPRFNQKCVYHINCYLQQNYLFYGLIKSLKSKQQKSSFWFLVFGTYHP